MSERLRDAARRAIADAPPPVEDARVERVVLEVEAEGRRELVTLELRDGELRWSSGAGDGPHVRAALAWVAGEPTGPTWRATIAPPTPEAQEADPSPLDGLVADVVTALARVGAEADEAPAVAEALRRLEAGFDAPDGGDRGRFWGRLRDALRAVDEVQLARLLTGARHLDRRTAVERVTDLDLLEVGRERLSARRASLERRYLLDLERGTVFREERPAGAEASVGPCPRRVRVGLAEREESAAPPRLRPMQYEVTLDVDATSLRRAESQAIRAFGELAATYRGAVSARPAEAEPVALVAPRRLDADGPLTLVDGGGAPLALIGDATGELIRRRLTAGERPTWLFGRLLDVESTLRMLPLGACWSGEGGLRFERLR